MQAFVAFIKPNLKKLLLSLLLILPAIISIVNLYLLHNGPRFLIAFFAIPIVTIGRIYSAIVATNFFLPILILVSIVEYYIIACIIFFILSQTSFLKKIVYFLIFVFALSILVFPYKIENYLFQGIEKINPSSTPKKLSSDKWKSYINKSKVFTVEYPENWSEVELNVGNRVEFEVNSCNLRRKSNCYDEKNEMRIDIVSSESRSTVEEWVTNAVSPSNEAYGFKANGGQTVTTLANEKAIKYSGTHTQNTKEGNLKLSSETIVANHNGIIWYIRYLVNVESDQAFRDEAKQIFQKISESFQFLN